jgi:hypothetical protein
VDGSDVKGERSAGGGPHLADPLGVLGQEDLKRVQLLRDTLDVVEPVDADNELDTLKALLERLDALLDGRLLEGLVELAGLDADWEGADVGVATLDEDAVRHRREAKNTRAGRQEVPRVVIRVEANEVAVEDAEQDLAPDGQNAIEDGREGQLG